MDRKRSPARLAVALVGAVALAVLLGACGGGGSGSDAGSDAEGSATTAPAPSNSCLDAPRPVKDVAYEDVPGVDPALVSLDVYPPAHGCPAPVVIWVHGGGWRIGDKGNQMPDKVKLLNDAGYVIVSVNYRLTDPASPDPVRYPTHDEDVAAAVAWVHDNVAEYGGDPARLALMGHSAGAQIVASVATDERYLGAHGLGLDALRCAAPLDTEGYDVAGPAGAGIDIYRNVFGDDPATWADASPQSHVAAGKGIPPFLLVERGTPARRRAAETFAQHLPRRRRRRDHGRRPGADAQPGQLEHRRVG